MFFSQAYKYLLKIHQLRQSSTTTNTDYQEDDLWSKEHSILIDGKIKTMSQEEYANWFNGTFEKMRLKDDVEETGYGDWLKSNEDVVTDTISSTDQMNKFIQNKKKQLRELVVHQDFQDMNMNTEGQFDLVRETPGNYGSSVFDKLQFEDLRKAHCESVIPVTEEDFHQRKKYTTVDQLNRERTQDMVQNRDQWNSSHENRLKDTNNKNEDINIERAYKLMNQDEMIRKNHDSFWSNLKRLEN